MTTPAEVIKMIEDEDVKFVDFRLTDTLGKEQHLTIPAHRLTEKVFEDGQPFDGSSIAGWKGIEASDMLLMPDASTARMDPFREQDTLVLTCDVVEPDTGNGYSRDPRSIARRAENYLKSTGIGDKAFFGPEPEFFIIDGVTWSTDPENTFFKIRSAEGAWSSKIDYEAGNIGHRPHPKHGYLALSPVESLTDIRSEAVTLLEQQGVPCEIHHHENGGPGQCEIGTKFSTLVERADWNQILKYTVWNVAAAYGKTATFMPKPITGDAGSGMHINQSVWKGDKNLFAGNGYAGLSQTALYYIGGIIRHARALNAITNPTTNSYKRLVPGYEAPVKLAYSARNRSASIRIPHVASEKARRVEVRFPDPQANPYLAFAAMLMAGLDGIQNRIDPGEPATKNLYDLPPEENAKIPVVCADLVEAVNALDADREFLTRGGVFTDDFLDAYLAIKRAEIEQYRLTVQPCEYAMYFSL